MQRMPRCSDAKLVGTPGTPGTPLEGTGGKGGVRSPAPVRDVVFSRMNGLEGLQTAKALGMLGIGLDGDHQQLLGETVLTSPPGCLLVA